MQPPCPNIAVREVSQRARPPARVVDLNGARLLAIFLVCFAHMSERNGLTGLPNPASLLWSFTQPGLCVFFILSGASARMGYEPLHSLREYAAYLRETCGRYVLPYFSLCMLAFVAACCLPRVFADPYYTASIRWLAIRPLPIPAMQLWYLYVLVEMTALLPLLLRLGSAPRPAWWALGVAYLFLRTLSLPDWLGISRLVQYLPYFLLGYFWGTGPKAGMLRRTWICGGAWLACAACLAADGAWLKTLCSLAPVAGIALQETRSLAGALLILGAGGLIAGRLTRLRRWLGICGVATLDIYMLHYPYAVIPLAKALFNLQQYLGRSGRQDVTPTQLWLLTLLLALACMPISYLLGRWIRSRPLLAYVLMGIGKWPQRKLG